MKFGQLRQGRTPKGLLILSACVLLTATSCRTPLGDDLPRPVGIGRANDGQFRFVVPLCAGESLSSFEIVDHQTERPVWKVSQPTRSKERNGVIVLGDASGFAKQGTSLKPPLPPVISVDAKVTSGDPPIGSGFSLDEISQDLAGTDKVLNMDQERVTEEEFKRQTSNKYC